MNSIKQSIAKFTCTMIKDNSTIALGAGTTINYLIDEIALQKKKVEFISAASSTSNKLIDYGLKELKASNLSSIDIMVDGMDNLINNNVVIKGLGGAPLGEKLLWDKSKLIMIIADYRKTKKLDKYIVPIEIIPSGLQRLKDKLRSYHPKLRIANNMGIPYITDFGNYVIDIECNSSINFINLHNELKLMLGVVETGIFTHKNIRFIIGDKKGVSILNLSDS